MLPVHASGVVTWKCFTGCDAVKNQFQTITSWHPAWSVHPDKQRAVNMGHSRLDLVSVFLEDSRQSIVTVTEVHLLRLGK